MKIGDKVKVIKDTIKQGASGRWIGQKGIITKLMPKSIWWDVEVTFKDNLNRTLDDKSYFKFEELELLK